jgi:protein-S-isoprenylcysteine O-methyltransferase Ste14
MHWLDYLIIGTYIAQAYQIFFYAVPSAGSTCEMFFNLKKKSNVAHPHPAAGVRQARSRMFISAAVTLAALAVTMIPMLSLLFPELNPYFLPLTQTPLSALSIISASLLISGNSLTFIAVATLRAHVRFDEFGETVRLHTAGIYGYIRNPITLGLAAIFAGFVLARPSVALLLGMMIFLLNAEYRIRMEEVYLQTAFSDEYPRYRNNVGKYFPKIQTFTRPGIFKNS